MSNHTEARTHDPTTTTHGNELELGIKAENGLVASEWNRLRPAQGVAGCSILDGCLHGCIIDYHPLHAPRDGVDGRELNLGVERCSYLERYPQAMDQQPGRGTLERVLCLQRHAKAKVQIVERHLPGSGTCEKS
jgi:hypothetical protein